MVLSCVEGSPAARAGIHEGDELVEINGKSRFKHLAFLSVMLKMEKSYLKSFWWLNPNSGTWLTMF